MFRVQQNIFDDVVAKATDENLTSVNWEYMLDVCDRATESASSPKDVVQALIKRLAHRNANVQLYSLELANSLAQNCGQDVHRELASRAFTEALLRLASDRNTHQQVKASIVAQMAEWTRMFQGNHELGIMEQAYNKLKQTNPNLHPPSKPVKQQITDADRRKEEDELQMALQLSIKENNLAASATASSNAPGPAAVQAAQPQQQQAAQPVASSGTTAATVSRVRALFDFQPSEPGELPFKKGDVIAVIESVYRDWWRGSLRGQTGIFPLNYVEKLSDPTPEELMREALMEQEVFGEIKNVEKLLTLLSTASADGRSMQENEEITTLYHSTLAIRPKLIELIAKYSQRKDDFTQLNEKFIKARKDYETLLEQSMSQPSASYGRPGQAPYGQPQYGQQPAYGQYPPQTDPSRIYSPGPAGVDPSRTPQPQYPPRNGPSPFYITGQAPPQQLQTAYAADPHNRTTIAGRPPNQAPADPYNRRPESTYENPQEIGTSGYHSPSISQGPSSGFAQQPQTQTYQPYAGVPPTQQQQAQAPYPRDSQLPPQHQQQQQQADGQAPYPGVFPPEDPLSPPPLNPMHGAHAPHAQQVLQNQGQAEGHPAYASPQYGAPLTGGAPAQPEYAPPAKPASPLQMNSAYPPYGTSNGAGAPPGPASQQQQQQGAYPGQAQYQAYQPPAAGQAQGQAGAGGYTGGGGVGDPSGFYR